MNENFMSHELVSPRTVSHSGARRLPVAQVFTLDKVDQFVNRSRDDFSIPRTVLIPHLFGRFRTGHLELGQPNHVADLE
jgi:hypothetical protein